MSRLFLCVTIDTECDKGAAWRTQLPMQFEGVTEGIARRLHPLFARHGAKATYLLSPEVMRDDASANVLRAIAKGHELGTHLHGEYVDEADSPAPITSAFQRDYPREVERDKLARLTAQFRAAFGHAPRSFRAGRFGVGQHSLALLEELGYHVDSSVTPFVDWSASGAPGLSFAGAPTQPYRPDRGDPTRHGTSALVEVPVTIRPHPWRTWPIVGRILEARPRWLRPTFSSERELVGTACAEIARARADRPRRAVFLNAMFHNVEVVPGASPYASSERGCRRLLRRLAALLRFAESHAITCIGLGDVPELVS
jgi:peptidoglycan/xylan/chitin deacetylase (PgdA/CDA1 family)